MNRLRIIQDGIGFHIVLTAQPLNMIHLGIAIGKTPNPFVECYGLNLHLLTHSLHIGLLVEKKKEA
jgi:hypothetical protein